MHNPPSQLAHPKYRPDVDGLRAIAIIAVILFHTFPEQLPGGFIGVDVFFVISGYLISTIIFSSLEQDSFSLMEFYVRRIRRIFPALIVVLVACLLIARFVLLPYEFRQLGKHTAASAGFIQNFILWKESGYFDAAAESKPLLHLWTLAVEEQFYIVWPLLLAFVWKRRWNFLAFTGITAAVSFAANIYLISSDPAAAFYLPVSRFWELMIGGILAYLKLHRPHLVDRNSVGQSILGLVLIVTGLLVLNESRDFPGWWALLPTLGAFLVISAGPDNWFNRKLLANKPMIWVGLISYPLYVWHWPLLVYLAIVKDDPSVAEKLGAVAIAISLSWLTYILVEKPIRFRGNSRVIAALLFATLLCVAVFGTFVFKFAVLKDKNATQTPINTGSTFDLESAYRLGECFLHGWPFETFPEHCDGDNANRPTVVLWGDSHAASLYRGLLKQSAILGFNLAQYNVADCPPVIDFDTNVKPICKEFTNKVLSKLRATRPDTVILASYWLQFDGKHAYKGKLWSQLPDEKLGNTLTTLKSLGIRNIIVVGQLPIFTRPQMSSGSRVFVQNVNNRSYGEFNFESNVADDRIRKIALANKVSFVSPIKTLCNEAGCLISTSLDKFKPLVWDAAHLTTDGSEYFIDAVVADNLLRLPR